MVKTIYTYVGVYNISSFYKISEIRIISQRVRFGKCNGSAEPQKWRFGAPLIRRKRKRRRRKRKHMHIMGLGRMGLPSV